MQSTERTRAWFSERRTPSGMFRYWLAVQRGAGGAWLSSVLPCDTKKGCIPSQPAKAPMQWPDLRQSMIRRAKSPPAVRCCAGDEHSYSAVARAPADQRGPHVLGFRGQRPGDGPGLLLRPGAPAVHVRHHAGPADLRVQADHARRCDWKLASPRSFLSAEKLAAPMLAVLCRKGKPASLQVAVAVRSSFCTSRHLRTRSDGNS